AGVPSSTSARVAARHTDTYDTSVRVARTTRTRSGPEKLSMTTSHSIESRGQSRPEGSVTRSHGPAAGSAPDPLKRGSAPNPRDAPVESTAPVDADIVRAGVIPAALSQVERHARHDGIRFEQERTLDEQ